MRSLTRIAQDGPLFEASFGVEAVFRGVNVARDGKTEKSDAYTFLKGDRMRRRPAADARATSPASGSVGRRGR